MGKVALPSTRQSARQVRGPTPKAREDRRREPERLPGQMGVEQVGRRDPPSHLVVTIRRPDIDDQQQLLASERDRAERLLNAVRLVVLGLLCGAALAYAPSIPQSLNIVNASLLAITLSWTVGQHRLFYQRDRLPEWLSVTNFIIDITAVTA